MGAWAHERVTQFTMMTMMTNYDEDYDDDDVRLTRRSRGIIFSLLFNKHGPEETRE